MENIFILFGIACITCVSGRTIIEQFSNGSLVGFTVYDHPPDATFYTGIFNGNMYRLDTRTLNSTYMEFEITASTTGWVGLILNPERPALQQSDVLIAGVYGDSGTPYYTDMHGDSNATLRADTKTDSDWILVSGEETSSPPQTRLIFHRRYNTSDPNVGQDYGITTEENVWYLSIMGDIDDPFPTLVNENALGRSQVNFVIGGTGSGESNGGGGALVGSLTFIFTLASIALSKMLHHS